MFQSKWTYIGAVIIAVFALAAIFAPWLAPYNPYDMRLAEQLSLPTLEHFMGQDANGVDIFSRLMHGARISLSVGVIVVLISGTIGITMGLVSGYYGGWPDTILMRLVDILMAFPGLLLAIALVSVLGPNILNVVIALTVLGWVSFARLVRGQVLSVKEREYIQAARTSGQSDARIMVVHIFPNILSPVIVQATFSVAGVIIAESSLSFLGLGAPPGTPSWGAMLSEGKQVILEAPHVSIFPGLAIMLVVMAFNFLGDGLRDRFDPKSTIN
ncbi:MAG: ABC transporter permease [Desulfobacteraceae bacterium]|nr:ABC transporter permease [Desulfobacteraceae bacterium]